MFREQSRLVRRAIRGALPRFSGGTGDRNPPKPPFSLVPSTARSLFGGTKRECGVESVGSVNSHALADKEQGNLRPKYAKRVPALRLGLFCKSLRRGTFHRRKVPKDRWGVSMRPSPLATPQAPEGCMHSAPRYISPIHNKKAPIRVLFFLFSAIMTTKCSRW